MTLKRTPLNAAHRAMDARLVDFGGWEMPLHYGSQLAEHQAVRQRAGMFDVSHMLSVDVTGRQARDYLQQLLANDVGRLRQPGKALYSCMLNEAGGILDDLIVYLLDELRFRVVVNAATAERDVHWMGSRAVGAGDVAITPRSDLAMIAVQGPHARDHVRRTLPELAEREAKLEPFFAAEAGDLLVARTGYTGEDGVELMLPASRAEHVWRALHAAGVAPAGLGARDTLRLEAGMNLYGQDMDESTTPYECGLEWTVDLRGGRDFVGRPALAASVPRARMQGLVLLDRGVLRGHQAVETGRGRGEITSGSFSPTLQVSIGLSRLPSEVGAGEAVRVNVRDKWLPARTVKYPFVRRGRSLVAGYPAAAG